MGGLFRALGKVGKGAATIAGTATAVIGALTQSGIVERVVIGGVDVGQVVMGTGVVLAAFGIGRRAGFAVADEEKDGQRVKK